MRNVVSLYCSSQEVGTSQDVTTAVQVKDHRESERRSVMQRIRVGTSPDAKAGRLLCGLSSRETLTT